MQYPYKPPFDTILSAEFIERPNRFIVHGRLDSGEVVRAFLPNPGRLQELLLPAVTIYLVPVKPGEKRKTKYTMVGVAGEGAPIFLHTHVNNDVARHLLAHDLVPGLEGATITRAEVPLGRSRFDFLLELEGEPVYVEVKSCTLFGNGVAMFPDAVTERGRRHLEELAELAEGGTRTAVIFVVHSGAVSMFMPDYHTDLAFAATLLAVRDRVPILPMGVDWNEDFEIAARPRLLPIPWAYIQREASDRGMYLVVCMVGEGCAIPAGYYLIVGWCDTGLGAFLRGVRRSGRGLGETARRVVVDSCETDVYPIVSSENRCIELVASLDRLPGVEVVPSGRSEAPEEGELRYARKNPLDQRAFHHVLACYRMVAPDLAD